MRKCSFFPQVLIGALLLFGTPALRSQCIATFPYHETFESGPGMWFAGGTNSDWVWGTPNKPVITGAAEGTKCWNAGGLTGPFYNLAERGWVQSPCFDFTGLAHPYIHFKIFWESELKFDGGNLQYSIDNGNTWNNVGAVNDPTDCFNANWYNYSPVNFLTTLATVRDGWSGNIQPTVGPCLGGSGSITWVEAKHCMPYLAGVPKVIFRFTFGAGTTCNNFDGMAFDDLYIEETPAIGADFNSLCIGPNTYSFTDQSTNCPETWNWNFGDPASGAANTTMLIQPTHTFSGPGIYTVTMTANSACSGPSTVTHTVQVNGVSATANAASCFGGADGSATATVNPAGGNPGYAWSSSPVQNTASATNLPAGTYTVTVTETGVCPVTASVTIAQPAAIAISKSSTPASCGLPSGTASASGSGGAGPYTYLWSDGSTGSTAVNLVAGTYVVTVTDQNGCTNTASIIVGGLPGVTAMVNVQTDVSCFGGSNGSATVVPTGGTGPYSYQWSAGAGTGMSATGLSAGLYSVTVTDANLCTSVAAVTIAEPNALQHNVSISPSFCGSSTGSATIQASGGTPGYTYIWTPSGGTGNMASNLPAGNYVVSITDQQNCTDTVQIQIQGSPAATATISTSADVNCFGGSDGSATVSVLSGTAPFNYTWTPTLPNAAAVNGLTAGNYQVTVSDVHACTATASITIIQPSSLSHSVSTQNAACGSNNGAATILESGGTGPYTYQWSPNGGTGASASGLAAGFYVVSVTDSHNCLDTVHISLSNIGGVQAAVSGVNAVQCFGGNDGSISISSMGGTLPYTYAWSAGGSIGPTANNLMAGTYTVTVTDALQCIVLLNATVSQPQAALLAQINNPSNVTCFGANNGSATVSSSGGTSPYAYAWSPAGGTGSTGSNLAPGTYTVTLTDAHLCTTTASVTITQPAALQHSVASQMSTCGNANGSAQIMETGGTAPYSYAWTPGGGSTNNAQNLNSGQYIVSITDSNACQDTVHVTVNGSPAVQASITGLVNVSCFGGNNGSMSVTVATGTAPFNYNWSAAGLNGANPMALSAGTYTVTITDAFQCTAVQSALLTQPLALQHTTSSTAASCLGNDGTASVQETGGTSPYTFAWSAGTGTGPTISGISPGTYSVTITDAQGCMDAAQVTVGASPGFQSSFSAMEHASCFGLSDGSLTLSTLNGTPPFTYNWTPPVATGAIANGLPAGDYQVQVTDAIGCTTQAMAQLQSPPLLISQISAGSVRCHGDANGTIEVDTTFGGQGPYTYSFEGSTYSSNTQFSDLAPGSYQLITLDAHGCSVSNSIQVNDVPQAQIQLPGDTLINLGDSIELQPLILSPSSDIQVQWTPPTGVYCDTCLQTLVKPLANTQYQVVITDQNGCTISASEWVRVRRQSIYVPNVFWPESDGFNHHFGVYAGSGVREIEQMQIFDRWGDLVFEQKNFPPNDPNTGWDGMERGEPAPSAVYVYVIQVRLADGSEVLLNGDVTLLR